MLTGRRDVLLLGGFSGELLVVHGEGFSYAFDFYTLTDPPHSHRYETEIRYTLRQGTVVNRKETRNSLRKQETDSVITR